MFDDGKVLPRTASGQGSITMGRADKAMRWLSANWPEGDIILGAFVLLTRGKKATVEQRID